MELDVTPTRPLHFVVESHIPYMRGVLEPFGTVTYLDPADITPAAVRDADALLVRTRTRCDAALLAGSRCRFVGTATIGTDHIDLPWCAANGITVANAPGCNAPAVAQYVLASVAALANRPISQYRIGIVGVGHVGRIVAQWAESLDMKVFLCDPPRQRSEGGDRWHSLDELARECDVITFHTPLTKEGPDATFHLADDSFFAKLRRAPIVINAARGPVADTEAIIRAKEQSLISHAVIDTWENEPAISQRLLELTSIATPHIAGYSQQGKARASRMVVEALAQAFGLHGVKFPGDDIAPVPARVRLSTLVDGYNPFADDARLRADTSTFELLRNTYPLRTEPGQ